MDQFWSQPRAHLVSGGNLVRQLGSQIPVNLPLQLRWWTEAKDLLHF